MIKIELRLFADLNKYTPENAQDYYIKDNMRIEELLIELGINKERAKIIFINGVKKNYKDLIKDGDRVGIFPAVGGG